ncbi:unnamed protein product [Sphagnum balticum]
MRRERRRELIREEILTAAARLFTEKGYEATSVDDVAETADVAKGTFYNYFESKEDLVAAMHQKRVDGLFQAAAQSLESGMPPLQVIKELLVDSARWSEENADMAIIFFNRGPRVMGKGFNLDNGPPPRFLDMQHLVVAAQEQNELRKDLDARFITGMFIHILFISQFMWVAEGKSGSVIERVQSWFQALLEGVQAQKENARISH